MADGDKNMLISLVFGAGIIFGLRWFIPWLDHGIQGWIPVVVGVAAGYWAHDRLVVWDLEEKRRDDERRRPD